jgi:hypothetical protein
MKIVKFTTLGIALGLLMATNAVAQDEPQMTLPASSRQVAYDYEYYADAGTTAPAAKPAAPAAAPAAGAVVPASA